MVRKTQPVGEQEGKCESMQPAGVEGGHSDGVASRNFAHIYKLGDIATGRPDN